MNPFEILQISQGASPDTVREAYHQLAKKWHPDRFSGPEKQAAEVKFREIAEAYAAIKKGAEGSSSSGDSSAAAPHSPPGHSMSSPAGKSPADWLAEAKKHLADKRYESAISLSQYCYSYPQVSEEAHLVHAKAIEATVKDAKAQARAYEEVMRINPNNKESIAKLAELYLALNMPKRAESMHEKAKSLGFSINSKQSKSAIQHSSASPVEPDGMIDKLTGFFRDLTKRG
jgi:tetratricopeptide (TPR) repeat protein